MLKERFFHGVEFSLLLWKGSSLLKKWDILRAYGILGSELILDGIGLQVACSTLIFSTPIAANTVLSFFFLEFWTEIYIVVDKFQKHVIDWLIIHAGLYCGLLNRHGWITMVIEL